MLSPCESPRTLAVVAMPPFEEFTEAFVWFSRHDGKEYPGPKTEDIETFTLTVGGTTSSIVGYRRTDPDSYFRAFVEACNEILPRIGHRVQR
jgi:hypothetical protein